MSRNWCDPCGGWIEGEPCYSQEEDPGDFEYGEPDDILSPKGGYLTPEAINSALDQLWLGTCPVCGNAKHGTHD